ncbi:hypothetical protein TWF281_005488 [Arthrobotrys megalospora]
MKFLSSLSLLSSDNQALREFLAYLPSVNADLSTLSAPTPLLLPKSVVEYPAAVALHHKLFLLPTFQGSAIDWAVSIFKNYICTLRVQANGCQFPGSETLEAGGSTKHPLKKPLNPFLGEVFVASVSDEGIDGDTKIICEQVSHHPPVTASYLSNQKRGINIQAYLGQRTSFTPMTGGITITQDGHALTHIQGYDEYHLTTFPTLNIKGLLSFGGRNRHLEYSGTSWIVSSSGLITEIVFEDGSGGGSLKGAFGLGGASNTGRDNSRRGVSAKISRWQEIGDGERKVEERPLATVQGCWDGRLTIRFIDSGREEAFEVAQIPMATMHTTPAENQSEWHSQKAWGATKDALANNDWKKAAEEKRKVEEWQRDLRQREEREGKKWIPRYFRPTNFCERAEYLAGIRSGTFSPTLRLGEPIWRFDQSRKDIEPC